MAQISPLFRWLSIAMVLILLHICVPWLSERTKRRRKKKYSSRLQNIWLSLGTAHETRKLVIYTVKGPHKGESDGSQSNKCDNCLLSDVLEYPGARSDAWTEITDVKLGNQRYPILAVFFVIFTCNNDVQTSPRIFKGTQKPSHDTQDFTELKQNDLTSRYAAVDWSIPNGFVICTIFGVPGKCFTLVNEPFKLCSKNIQNDLDTPDFTDYENVNWLLRESHPSLETFYEDFSRLRSTSQKDRSQFNVYKAPEVSLKSGWIVLDPFWRVEHVQVSRCRVSTLARRQLHKCFVVRTIFECSEN